jgi:hypothetical protein
MERPGSLMVMTFEGRKEATRDQQSEWSSSPSEADSLKVIDMDTKLYDVGSIESGTRVPQTTDSILTPGQQRVLELEDGDSFVLQTIRLAEGHDVAAQAVSSSAAHIAARLASWARNRHVRLVYRMIDKDTARIWRLGKV